MDNKLTDNEIINALECCVFGECEHECSAYKNEHINCIGKLKYSLFDLLNRQKTEIERLKDIAKSALNESIKVCDSILDAKSEAIKEFAEKITEIFTRYAHLHSYAEGARKDYIETVDGKEIEMQSVWDVITLQMNGMAEYEEMGRLQKNIETIEKERLLTELEKDFRLLVKEMTEGGEK